MATNAAEETSKPKKKKTKKAKTKKDKWGQLVLAPVDDVEQEQAEEQPPRGEEKDDVPVGGGALESYEPNKVVVSGMPYTTSEQQIRDLFKDIGPVVQLQLSRFPDSGNFRGLAFVTFLTEEMAMNSLELDGTTMGNRFIKIERCRLGLGSQRKRKSEFLDEPKKVEGCFSAYVGNLSWDVTEDDIRECFKNSRVSSVRLALDKRTGASRGFCHVDFEDDESLEKAMEKNKLEFHGRAMKISYAISNRN
ncbi:nucleolin 1 [Canna indica]|uniref:Nucleolin 1 n=1 Tax=Canna indica TaxID=4628 RepID=A0AAQ3QIP1_9LILI|nr:nucleolin 1 [Canna indica]